jgi:hypothetical protein
MTTITNLRGLPGPLETAVKASIRRPEDGVIHVTELIDSPLVRHLRTEHWDSLVEDVSDRIWALIGTAVHQLAEHHARPGEAETRLTVSHPSGIRITGQSDLLENSTTMTDWKVTSVWSVIYGDIFAKWEAQLNVYRWLYHSVGIESINRLQVVAILRDWQQSKAKREKDYPQLQVQTFTLPLWPIERAAAYVNGRIALHADAAHYVCDADDRWEKPTTYAVKKPGRKTALRVLDNARDADRLAADVGGEVEIRAGASVRCADYCAVSEVCPYKSTFVREINAIDASE